MADEFIPFPGTYLSTQKLSTQYMTYSDHRGKRYFSLLERDETRRVGGTDTGSTVLDGLAVMLSEICLQNHKQRQEMKPLGKTYYEIENSAR